MSPRRNPAQVGPAHAAFVARVNLLAGHGWSYDDIGELMREHGAYVTAPAVWKVVNADRQVTADEFCALFALDIDAIATLRSTVGAP